MYGRARRFFLCNLKLNRGQVHSGLSLALREWGLGHPPL